MIRRSMCLIVWGLATIFFHFGCAGTVPEQTRSGADLPFDLEEYVASVKRDIDPLITCEDAMDSISAVRGQVVKWHGFLLREWTDKLLIATPGREESWNHYILLLDHPLPQESVIGDLVQTVSRGDAIYAAGRILDRRTIVLKSGSDLTIPHLECLIISKENDRQFARPVWVRESR